jgi:hypothetical protein
MPRVFRILCIVFAFCLSLTMASAQLPDQTAPDPSRRHGVPPPDTRLTKMEAESRLAESDVPLKIAFGRKSQQWTTAKLAGLPHETLQFTDSGKQNVVTFSGVPLMALLVEVGVPQRPKGKDLRLVVVAESRDGSKVAYSLAEVSPEVHDGSVLLADSADGKPLGDENGPIELICSGDRSPARWIRGLAAIRVVAAD